VVSPGLVPLLMGLLLGIGFGVAGVVLHRRLKLRGCVRVLTVSGDSKKALLWHVRPVNGNEVVLPPAEKGGTPRRVILEGAAALNGGLMPTWIVHERHGVNFQVPADAEVLDTELARRLVWWNPASYFYASKANSARSTFRAQEEKTPWYATMAPLGIVAILALVGALVWIAWLFTSRGGGA
jgi:hypothetical protein